MNLVNTADFWQYRAVNLTAVFDDPFRSYKISSTESMLKMFWTRHPDSIQELFELTTENRCQDTWLSVFLRRARYADMEHELYCFMHGLPTKHAGSWMPQSDDVLCNSAACENLYAAWAEELSSRTPRSWEERCKDECNRCQQHRQTRCRVLQNPEDQKN